MNRVGPFGTFTLYCGVVAGVKPKSQSQLPTQAPSPQPAKVIEAIPELPRQGTKPADTDPDISLSNTVVMPAPAAEPKAEKRIPQGIKLNRDARVIVRDFIERNTREPAQSVLKEEASGFLSLYVSKEDTAHYLYSTLESSELQNRLRFLRAVSIRSHRYQPLRDIPDLLQREYGSFLELERTKKDPEHKKIIDGFLQHFEFKTNNFSTRLLMYRFLREVPEDRIGSALEFLRTLSILKANNVKGTAKLFFIAEKYLYKREHLERHLIGLFFEAQAALALLNSRKITVKELSATELRGKNSRIVKVQDIDIMAENKHGKYIIEVKCSGHNSQRYSTQIKELVEIAEQCNKIPILLVGNIRTLLYTRPDNEQIEFIYSLYDDSNRKLKIWDQDGNDLTQAVIRKYKQTLPTTKAS